MKYDDQKTILDEYPPHVISDKLGQFINDKRKERIESVISGRLQGIQLAIESPADMNNAFAAIRTCEALGVSDIHLITTENNDMTRRRITKGSVYWVNIHYYKNIDEFLIAASKAGLVLAGGAIDATVPLSKVSVEKPLCIMVGNEHRGLSKTAQAACDICYQIPMYGMSESMNLSVSAAISLYDTTARKRAMIGTSTDLNEQEQSVLRAQYYLNSVSTKLPEALF